jgi:hypothetical protein
MITIRKIDLYGQYLLGTLMIFSIPVLFLYGFGFGLLIMECWQLLSALANSYSFVKTEMKKEIRNYWIFSAIDLTIFFSPPVLTGFFDRDDLDVLPGVGATGGVAIAIYYLWIYKKLISLLDYKSSINGIIKK